MSFASDTKSELLSLIADKCCKLAELSALLRMNGNINLSSEGLRIEFQTTNIQIARKVIKSSKELYRVEVDIVSKKQMKLKKNDIYIIIIKDKASEIINELGLMNNTDNYQEAIESTLIIKECCKRSYLRGAFLAAGSINSPKSSSYHLEIHSTDEVHALALQELMTYFYLNSKVIKKKRGYITYIKESEKIADFLRVTGAINALFEFEDERIKRDFVNSITRVINMEIANQNKTLDAANRQLRSISVLENMVDTTKLPKSMREAITLRKEFPESSLNEISAMSEQVINKRVSKSALNHRYRNINDLAQQILDDLNE
ncbi:MAG: Sporulation transcription regulator WhiA [Candidatus Izimaplasma bacterium HR2]|nr:MAG: Sporulation transcription regulator WhiA [Candidatus Izimaplasma bacterium HR2]